MKNNNYFQLLIFAVLLVPILFSCKSSFPASGTLIECNGKFLKPILNPTKRPEFHGGGQAFHEFLRTNINLPNERRNEVKGKVRVAFVVTSEGNICDVRITSKPKKYIDSEVVRVFEMMPKWIPATHEGKVVDCYHLIDIKF